jgi:hypothetical protein
VSACVSQASTVITTSRTRPTPSPSSKPESKPSTLPVKRVGPSWPTWSHIPDSEQPQAQVGLITASVGASKYLRA